MSTEPDYTLEKQSLQRINEKFDEIDILVYDYLQLIRRRGGTLGFCVGSIANQLREKRMSLNTMCNKLSAFQHKRNLSEKENTPSEEEIVKFLELACINTWHIKDKSTIGINWVYRDIPKWEQKIYAMKTQHVIWRGQSLVIDGNVERNHFGATVSLKIVFGEKTFHHFFTKYKYLAGSSGDPLPVISTDTHRLHIRPYLTGITLSDIPLEKEDTGSTESFRVIQEVEI